MLPLLFLLLLLSVFGEAKLCKFDGGYYCYECHLDEERLIPARILMNWDFRKHRVCLRSAEFLDSIETMPVLNVEETNKALYHYIPELEQTRVRGRERGREKEEEELNMFTCTCITLHCC